LDIQATVEQRTKYFKRKNKEWNIYRAWSLIWKKGVVLLQIILV